MAEEWDAAHAGLKPARGRPGRAEAGRRLPGGNPMARAEVYPTWGGRGAAKAGRRRRGMSLVEILIVLALLTIGIFAIIRLFPQGFASINATGDILLADTLATKNEEYARKLRENLPDAIVGIDNAGNILTNIQPDSYLGTRQYGTLTAQDEDGKQVPVQDPRFSLGNLTRRVIGEQVKVSPPTAMSVGGVNEQASIYAVLYGPIYSAAAMLPASLGVSARSATPMQRVVFQDPPTQENWLQLRALGDFGYGINYEQGKLYLAYFDKQAIGAKQAWDRRLIVDFQYHPDPNTTLRTPPGGQPLLAQVSNDPGWDPVTPDWTRPGWTFDLQPNMEPGSDVVVRGFLGLPNSQPFSQDADPYEFKVYDTATGLIGFKPALSTLPLPQQQGRGITAKVDYDVDDWQILRQDLVLPTEVVDPNNGASPYYSFKLSTGSIKQLGETEDTVNFDAAGNPAFTYAGLIRYYPDTSARKGTNTLDLLIVDLDTGLWIGSDSLQPDLVAGNGTIDYRNGIIHLNPNAQWNLPPVGAAGGAVAMSPAGRHVRIFYRTLNEFAVTPVKAWSGYLSQPTAANLGSAPFRGQDFLPSTGGYLLFPLVSADKVLSVDYNWTSNSGVPHHESGEVHRVEVPGVPGEPPGNPGYAWIRLSPGLDITGDFNPNSVQVTGVRGSSFQTLVTWRESKQWRRRVRSTMLSREQSQ